MLGMTRQEMFNKACDHLIKQGCKSSSFASCKYRGPNGTMCAIGALIPDNLYTEYMDRKGMGAGTLYETKHYIEKFSLRNEDKDFAVDLQQAHDMSRNDFFKEDVVKKLKNVATRYNLEIPDCIKNNE